MGMYNREDNLRAIGADPWFGLDPDPKPTPIERKSTMNGTQVQTTLAVPISFLAGLLAGKNVFGFDTATWTTIIGAVAGLVATIWGALATRKTALVTTVADLPEVKGVTLNPVVPGVHELNAATPSNVKVGP